MRITDGVKLDFQDVLIVPQRSSIASRKEVVLKRTYKFAHVDWEWDGIGVIASNMDTTGTFAMAKEFQKYNMLVALHKHYSEQELYDFFINEKSWCNVFYTVGISNDDKKKLLSLKKKLESSVSNVFPRFLNIDVANGYTERFIEVVKEYRKLLPETVIMAGNVVTSNIAEELIMSGADIVKVGIGSGSVCTTRLKTGVGYGQLSAVDDCSFAVHGKPHGHICSDGGCVTAGDVCKAFCAGSDFVMLGGFFSGTDECDGEWTFDTIDYSFDPPKVIVENRIKKSLKFYGMSSEEAQDKYSNGLSEYKASEGKCVEIPYKGPVKHLIQDVLGGLRSCASYIGANSLKEMQKCALFARMNRTHNTVYSS